MTRACTTALRSIAVAILLSGCGSSAPTQAEQDQKAEEYAKSFGVDVDVQTRSDGTQSVTIDRSLGGQTAQAGTNLALPPGFPNDIPMYPDLNIVTSSQLPSQGFMVQGRTGDSSQQVAEFYVAQMTAKGWMRDGTGAQTPVMQVLQFKKGNRMASINVLPSGNSNTVVQLTTMVAG